MDVAIERYLALREKRGQEMTDKKPSRFNWPLVLATSSLGLILAAVTIAGALPDTRSTMRAWVAMFGIIGLAVGLRVSDRPLLHGFVAGFLAGLVAIETQALFLTTYFVNNPQYVGLEMPFGWPPRVATAVLGPLNAVVAGVIAGALAWAFWKIRGAVMNNAG